MLKSCNPFYFDMVNIVIKKTKDGLLIPTKTLQNYGYVTFEEYLIKISEDTSTIIIEPITELIKGD